MTFAHSELRPFAVTVRAYLREGDDYVALEHADGSAYAAQGDDCHVDPIRGLAPQPLRIVATFVIRALGPALRVRSIITGPPAAP